jgi:GTP cyclohydrolase FolE2
MNRLIISILLLISFDVQSQNDTINIPLNEAGKAEFINVLKIENASKESLFQKVAEYLQYNKMFIEFKNDKGVLKPA